MNIKKEELLERIGSHYDEILMHIEDSDHEKERKDYFKQKCVYKKISDSLTTLIKQRTSLANSWMNHNDLRNELAERNKEAHFELGISDTIDCVLHFAGKEDSVNYTKVMKELRNHFYSGDYDTGMVVYSRSEKCRDANSEFWEKDALFQKELEAFPDLLDLYSNTFLEERMLLEVTECEEFYFAGCRAALHAILDTLLD